VTGVAWGVVGGRGAGLAPAPVAMAPSSVRGGGGSYVGLTVSGASGGGGGVTGGPGGAGGAGGATVGGAGAAGGRGGGSGLEGIRSPPDLRDDDPRCEGGGGGGGGGGVVGTAHERAVAKGDTHGEHDAEAGERGGREGGGTQRHTLTEGDGGPGGASTATTGAGVSYDPRTHAPAA
jgi:hypothetical protein